MQDNGFSEISYTCGFLFYNIQLPHGVNVHVKDHDCADPIQHIYYLCVFEPICIHFGIELKYCEDDGTDYPQCADCHQAPIPKRAKLSLKTFI